jgi:hypothetical protein
VSFFDSHAHIGAPDLLEDASAMLERARSAGVSGVLAIGAGYGIGANAGAVAVADAHPDVWATTGVHPHDASEWNVLAERAIDGWLVHKRVVWTTTTSTPPVRPSRKPCEARYDWHISTHCHSRSTCVPARVRATLTAICCESSTRKEPIAPAE